MAAKGSIPMVKGLWADAIEDTLFRAPSTSTVSTSVSQSPQRRTSPKSSETGSTEGSFGNDSSSDDDQAVVLNLHSMVEPPQFVRTRLNVKAREFVSKFQPVCPVPAVDPAIKAAMKEVMAALAVSDVTAQVERVWEQHGWSIVATVPAIEAGRKHFLLKQAQEALLSHAEQSPGLFVLDSGAQPFTLTTSGFAVALWSTKEEESVCWDSVSKGFCSRGRCCNWRHPSNVTSIHIRVAVAGSM